MDCHPPNETEQRRNTRRDEQDVALKEWTTAVRAWLGDVERVRRDAEQRSNDAFDAFVSSFSETLTEVPRAEGGTNLLEALYDAELVTQGLRQNLGNPRFRLLLFTDLEEYRTRPTGDLAISLAGADVLVALVPVNDPATFIGISDQWRTLLSEAGATRVVILPERLTDAATILDELRQWERQSSP